MFSDDGIQDSIVGTQGAEVRSCLVPPGSSVFGNRRDMRCFQIP